MSDDENCFYDDEDLNNDKLNPKQEKDNKIFNESIKGYDLSLSKIENNNKKEIKNEELSKIKNNHLSKNEKQINEIDTSQNKNKEITQKKEKEKEKLKDEKENEEYEDFSINNTMNNNDESSRNDLSIKDKLFMNDTMYNSEFYENKKEYKFKDNENKINENNNNENDNNNFNDYLINNNQLDKSSQKSIKTQDKNKKKSSKNNRKKNKENNNNREKNSKKENEEESYIYDNYSMVQNNIIKPDKNKRENKFPEDTLIDLKIKEKNNSFLFNDNAFYDPEENTSFSNNQFNNEKIVKQLNKNILLINKKYNINNNEKLFYVYDENNINLSCRPISSLELINYIKTVNIEKVKFRLIDIFGFYNQELYSFLNLKVLLNKNWVNNIIENPLTRKIFNRNNNYNENKDLSFDSSVPEIMNKLDQSLWSISVFNNNNNINNINNKLKENLIQNENNIIEEDSDEWEMIDKKKNKITKQEIVKQKKIVGLDDKKQKKIITKENNDILNLNSKKFKGKDKTSYGKFLNLRNLMSIEEES